MLDLSELRIWLMGNTAHFPVYAVALGTTGVQKSLLRYLHRASIEKQRRTIQSSVDRVLTLVGTSIFYVSCVFMIFPMIDLTVSHWVAKGPVFVLAEQPLLRGLRDVSRQSTTYIIIIMSLLIGLHVFLPRRYQFCRPHKPLFVFLSFVVGPVLVGEPLKFLIGRARPRELLEFGGNAEFTPVWQFSGACTRNCSFPSGEAAAAAAAMSLLIFIPVRFRRSTAFILAPCLLLIAFNRVLFGAHFLSDVMLGSLVTVFAMGGLWRWLEPRSEAIDRFFGKSSGMT